MNGDPEKQALAVGVSPEEAQASEGSRVMRRGRPPKVRSEPEPRPEPNKRMKGRKSLVAAIMASQGITPPEVYGRDGRPKMRRRIVQPNPV